MYLGYLSLKKLEKLKKYSIWKLLEMKDKGGKQSGSELGTGKAIRK